VPEAKRGLGGEDLDDVPAEVEQNGDKKRRREEEDDEGSGESDGEGYYELVKRKSKESKQKKKAEHDALTALERIDPDAEASSGPRSLTRAILANRGLTPHRSNKAARNPRVKKRQKFDKAKKKVASQKAVFKGGVAETKGRYEGERTGVSKVVKSVRL